MKTGAQPGNQNACKPLKRDGRLNVRFNSELKAKAIVEAKSKGLNLSDYFESLFPAKLKK